MKYPPRLIDAFKKLTDEFENAIRADERQRLLTKFRAEHPEKPVAKPEPLYPITGLHGEPLMESGPQPVDVLRVELNDTHRTMLSYLRQGFMAVPTLAGHAGIKKQSVYTYLGQLEQMGYKLERKSTGNIRGGYRLIYRLAKSA